MEGDTVNVIFKVVQQANKSRFDTYRHQNVPIFDNVDDLRKFLLEPRPPTKTHFVLATSPAEINDLQ